MFCPADIWEKANPKQSQALVNVVINVTQEVRKSNASGAATSINGAVRLTCRGVILELLKARAASSLPKLLSSQVDPRMWQAGSVWFGCYSWFALEGRPFVEITNGDLAGIGLR